MPLPHFAFVLALVPALVLGGCSVQAPSEEAAAAEAPHASAVRPRQAAKVRTAAIERRTMQRVLETTAAVESLAEIQVVAEAGGQVIQVVVEEGTQVSTGDLMARLDDRDQAFAVADAEVAVAEARAAVERAGIAEQEAAAGVRSAVLNLEQAERDHERNVQLMEGAETSALSEQALEASRLARDNAKEALAQAELAEGRSAVDSRTAASALQRAELTGKRAERDLERTRILAPIDGVVALRSIEPGRSATVGQSLFELVDLDRLRVVFYRPQRELELFRGREASGVSTLTATTEAAPGHLFSGTIERVSPTVDRTSGAFRVTARLEPSSTPPEGEEPARLLPGMLLRLAVVTGEHPDAFVVPKRALRREGSSVFVVAVVREEDRSVATRIAVTEGYEDDERIEVLPQDDEARALFAAGWPVITVGGRELEKGDVVVVEWHEGAWDPEHGPGPGADEPDAAEEVEDEAPEEQPDEAGAPDTSGDESAE